MKRIRDLSLVRDYDHHDYMVSQDTITGRLTGQSAGHTREHELLKAIEVYNKRCDLYKKHDWNLFNGWELKIIVVGNRYGGQEKWAFWDDPDNTVSSIPYFNGFVEPLTIGSIDNGKFKEVDIPRKTLEDELGMFGVREMILRARDVRKMFPEGSPSPMMSPESVMLAPVLMTSYMVTNGAAVCSVAFSDHLHHRYLNNYTSTHKWIMRQANDQTVIRLEAHRVGELTYSINGRWEKVGIDLTYKERKSFLNVVMEENGTIPPKPERRLIGTAIRGNNKFEVWIGPHPNSGLAEAWVVETIDSKGNNKVLTGKPWQYTACMAVAYENLWRKESSGWMVTYPEDGQTQEYRVSWQHSLEAFINSLSRVRKVEEKYLMIDKFQKEMDILSEAKSQLLKKMIP